MKKIRLFSDPMIAAEAIVFYILFPTITLPCVITTWFYEGTPLETDVFLTILSAIVPLALYFFSPTLSIIELNDKGIKVMVPLRKGHFLPYRCIKGFHIAYYNHYHKKRFFIVLSVKPMGTEYISKINRLSCSDEIVKINLTRGRYKILCEILPEKFVKKLDEAIHGDVSKVALDIDKLNRKYGAYNKNKRKKS